LFLVADRFHVAGLKKVAECELMNSLNMDNVAEILMLFDVHECETEGLEAIALKLVLFV
jgi:hypothetical protein